MHNRIQFVSGLIIEEDVEIHSFDTLPEINQATAPPDHSSSENLSSAEEPRAHPPSVENIGPGVAESARAAGGSVASNR